MRVLFFVLWLSFVNDLLPQSLYNSPHIETRLWCLNDIYLFKQELIENLARKEKPKDSNTIDEKKEYRRDGMEYRGDPESMVFTANDILKNLPAAIKGVQSVMLGAKSSNGMAIHGYDLLVAVWRQIVRDREALRRLVWGISQITPWSDLKPDEAKEKAYKKYNEKWGSDPQKNLGSLPDVCNCYWYLAVEYESEDIIYNACLIKKGSIFENWDSKNTTSVAHLAGKRNKVLAPYPTNIIFMIKLGETRIRFSDYIYLAKSDGERVFPRKPNSNKFLKIEPSKFNDSYVEFKFNYPLWDEGNNKWVWGKAVLSSSESDLWNKMKNNDKAINISDKMKLGKIYREWGGEYIPENQMK